MIRIRELTLFICVDLIHYTAYKLHTRSAPKYLKCSITRIYQM